MQYQAQRIFRRWWATGLALLVGCCLVLTDGVAQGPSVGHGPGSTKKPAKTKPAKSTKAKPPAARRAPAQTRKPTSRKQTNTSQRSNATARKTDAPAVTAQNSPPAKAAGQDEIKPISESGSTTDTPVEITSGRPRTVLPAEDRPVTAAHALTGLITEGDRLAELGRIDEAVLRYGQALRLEPDSVEVRARLTRLLTQVADAAVKAQQYAAARVHYRQMLEFIPADTQLQREVAAKLQAHGRKLVDAGQYADALPFLTDALNYAPENEATVNLKQLAQAQLERERGEQLLAEDNPQEALKIFEAVQPVLGQDQALARLITLARKRSELVPALVRLKGGRFKLGSNSGPAEEQPVHEVELTPFFIAQFEITNELYRRFCDDTRRQYPPDPLGWDNYFIELPDYPVVNVTFNDAVSFCAWLSKQTGQTYRLPTEAEWEYAARGELGTVAYSWGNYYDYRRANGREFQAKRATSQKAKTLPGGQFDANNFELFDMIGNVAEWCADYFDPEYYARREVRHPQGPASGRLRVVRGGSWDDKADDLRVARRRGFTPLTRSPEIGFRIVREVAATNLPEE